MSIFTKNLWVLAVVVVAGFAGPNLAWAQGVVITQPGASTPAPNPAPGNPNPAPQPGPAVQQFQVFVVQNGQQAGPFDQAGLQNLIATGALTRETLVWQQGMANWEPAGTLPALQAMLQNAPAPTPVTPPDIPQPKFDPKAYLAGTWYGGELTVPDQGFGPGRLNGTTTYAADGTVSVYATIDFDTDTGLIRQTISGNGTYKAQMQGANTILITPTINLTSYVGDQPPATSVMNTPFTAKVIDQNTTEDKDGNRYFRQQ